MPETMVVIYTETEDITQDEIELLLERQPLEFEIESFEPSDGEHEGACAFSLATNTSKEAEFWMKRIIPKDWDGGFFIPDWQPRQEQEESYNPYTDDDVSWQFPDSMFI